MNDWHTYMLTLIASDVKESKRKIEDIKQKLETITTLGQRLAFLAALASGAVLTNVAPETVAQTLAALLGAATGR